MESNEREAKLKASSRQRATHWQMDDAYQPIRARALLTLCYNRIYVWFFEKKNSTHMRIEQNNSGLNLNANAKTTEQMLDHF